MLAMRLSAAILLLLPTGALAADPPPGASSCSGCHAVNPRTNVSMPRIQGRGAADIAAAMADFRSGKRASTVMDRIAKGFTESETQAIATWLSQQK